MCVPWCRGLPLISSDFLSPADNYKLQTSLEIWCAGWMVLFTYPPDRGLRCQHVEREESWLRSIHCGQSAVILIKTTELFLLKIPRHVPAREDWQYLMSTRGKLSNVITYIQLGEIQLLVLITQKIRGNTPECGWTENHRGAWVTLRDDEIKIMIPECLSPLRQI